MITFTEALLESVRTSSAFTSLKEVPLRLLKDTFFTWLWEHVEEENMHLVETDAMAQLAKEISSPGSPAFVFPAPYRVPKKRSQERAGKKGNKGNKGNKGKTATQKQSDTVLVRDLSEVGMWHIEERLRKNHPYHRALKLGDVHTMRALTSLMASSLV
tara:strand:- start:7290 stop:7763 length:474 start_codon:yes stop_codon:yes gene_type:complete